MNVVNERNDRSSRQEASGERYTVDDVDQRGGAFLAHGSKEAAGKDTETTAGSFVRNSINGVATGEAPWSCRSDRYLMAAGDQAFGNCLDIAF
nr:hypothetical protein [Yimella sp. cx-51]